MFTIVKIAILKRRWRLANCAARRPHFTSNP